MRITTLDGLRGVFSLMIIFFHYPKASIPNWFYDFFLIRESHCFVDFFFVLSGFVISYNYHHLSTKSQLWVYLKKRFIRIYPLLFYTSILAFGYILFSKLVLIKFFPQLFQNIGFSYHENIKPFLDGIFLTNSTPILGTSLGVNTPSWSISSEMISYLIFGITMVSFSKKTREIVLILIILFSAIYLFSIDNFFSTGSYGFLRGLIGFMSGYFVWKVNNKAFKFSSKLEILIPIFLITIFYFLNLIDEYSTTGALFGIFIIPLFFSLSILILLKTKGFISKLLDTKPIQYLGKLSYSIYLNHMILITVVVKPFSQLFNITGFNQFIVMFLFVVITIIYSHFTYKYVEVMGANFLKKKMLK